MFQQSKTEPGGSGEKKHRRPVQSQGRGGIPNEEMPSPCSRAKETFVDKLPELLKMDRVWGGLSPHRHPSFIHGPVMPGVIWVLFVRLFPLCFQTTGDP